MPKTSLAMGVNKGYCSRCKFFLGLKSNQNVVGYPYNHHSSITAVSTSCLAGYDCVHRVQSLVRLLFTFSPVAPSDTTKTREEASSPIPAWFLSILAPKCEVSSAKGSYLVLRCNHEEQEVPVLFWNPLGPPIQTTHKVVSQIWLCGLFCNNSVLSRNDIIQKGEQREPKKFFLISLQNIRFPHGFSHALFILFKPYPHPHRPPSPTPTPT